jgi:hypothetical protein
MGILHTFLICWEAKPRSVFAIFHHIFLPFRPISQLFYYFLPFLRYLFKRKNTPIEKSKTPIQEHNTLFEECFTPIEERNVQNNSPNTPFEARNKPFEEYNVRLGTRLVSFGACLWKL